MKKLFLIILFIICLPVIINAKSYTSEASKTNNYMNKSNYSNTYKRYLLFSDGHNLKLGFSGGKVVKDDVFDTVTGFISSEEYKLTLPSTGTSYLYDGTTYWTLTGNSKKETIFFSEPIIDNGLKELEKNTTNPNIDSRATVYVKSDTNVTGTGKQTDPWIFVPRFEVTVKVSDAKHAKIREKETDDWKSEINGIYLVARKKSGSGEAKVTVSLDSGYMLMSNDCNGKITDTDNINQKIFTVSNISRDTKCTLAVGTGRFIVKLGDKNYDNTDINPIYLRHSDNYYSNENYTDIIRKIKIPTRIGYTFDRYEYNSKEIIDKDGNLKDKVSITSTNAKDDNNKDIVLLTSVWHPNEYEVSFDPNGGMIDGSTNPVTRKYLYDRQYKERYASFPFVTRAGYSFIGWYTKATGGAKVTESDILTTADNIVLYAHWDICKEGTYNDGSLASCKNCDAGTYQDKKGQSSCNTCVVGSNSLAGASKCSPCGDGRTTTLGTFNCKNCDNSVEVKSWLNTTWEPDNTMKNLCIIGSCNEGYKISNNNCVSICSTGYIYIDGECKPTKTEWTVAGRYEFNVFKTGKYSLEVWGAQGGMVDVYNQGYGGYSYGEITLTKDTTLYVYVGGKGASKPKYNGGEGGFNGGGTGGKSVASNVYGGAGGGGASHIATRTGLLSELKDYNSDILIVAGGGGGNGLIGSPERDCTFAKAGGSGGGYKGNNGSTGNNGGTQSTGFSFGIGGTGRNASYANSAWFCGLEGGAGSGGGYYGGTTSTKIGANSDSGGAGGSGYIGNPLLKNKYMYCFKCSENSGESTKTYTTNNNNSNPVSKQAKSGAGAARITYIGY